MNMQMNENIILRTKQLFKTLFQLDVVAGTPYEVDPDSDFGWDISGVISVVGSLSGMIAVRYPNKLTELMLKQSRLNVSESDGTCGLLCDMVGEVSNTIAGNILSGIGLDQLWLSVPVAIQGENHIISWPRNTRITAFPFSLTDGTFVVQTGLK